MNMMVNTKCTDYINDWDSFFFNPTAIVYIEKQKINDKDRNIKKWPGAKPDI